MNDILENKYCSFGCGRKAIKKFKNGRYCCESNQSKCPAIRKRIIENHADSKEIYRNLPQEIKERMKWCKGLTKETDIRVKNIALKRKEYYKNPNIHGSFYGRKHTEETKRKISIGTSKAYNYEANRKSGRGRGGYYKGFWCDSTYELAFIIYCLDHNIKIERNTEYFLYEYKGKQRRYYPDFIIDGILYEIKGFSNGQLPFKIKSVLEANKNYKILFPKDLKYVFDYIKKEYNKDVGKNISDLYTELKR